jgi:hypothetical protein
MRSMMRWSFFPGCPSTMAVVLALGALGTSGRAAEGARSEWIHPGADGRLVYKTTPAGDRIMDFSHAGYRGGGVALPDVPVKVTVYPGWPVRS